MAENFNQSKNWYKFLNNLYLKFSEYEIQKDRKRYNVANLEDWGHSDKPQGIEINENNLIQFWNNTAEYNITGYDDIKMMTITNLHLRELNNILNLTLKHKIRIRCIEPYIFIEGDYIRIRDIFDDMFTIMDNNCMEVFLPGKFLYINVFALNTFFIDDDVLLSEEIVITVIAPKWEVIGTRKIELYGLNVKSASGISFSLMSETIKAKDSAYPGGKGEDGKPGAPGGIGGSFFGIGENFINGEYLTITSIGGSGGPGQDGGNGGNGADGSNPTLPSNISCRDDLCDNGKKINLFRCQKKDCIYVPEVSLGVVSYELIGCEYKIFGTPGNKGGNGGDGGRGGKGGYPGIIMLFELNEHSGIGNYTNTGKDGRNGKGGIGGIGGTSGEDLEVNCSNQYVFWSTWSLDKRIYNRRSQSGRDGINGANTRNIEYSKTSRIVQKSAKTINQYKGYVRNNLTDRIKKIFLVEFLSQLENNKEVKSTYETLDFVHEYQGLEEQFHYLSENVDFLPFYQSFLNRISEYAQNKKEIKNFRDRKKVLRYLYAAALGRVHNFKDNLESNLITDIFEYLEFVKKDIDKLKDLEHSKNKIDIINKYKQKYKEGIDRKIKEAEEFISKEITLEIDHIDNQIGSRIEVLIDEVIKLQGQSKTEHKKLTEEKQNLENALTLQGLFASIKIAGQVVSFLGTFGQVAGSAIDVGSTMAESFVLDSQDGNYSTLQLPQSEADLEMLKDRIKNIKTQNINRLSTLLEHTSLEINKYPEKLGNVSVEIIDIQDKLSKIEANKFDFKQIQDLENELEAVLQTQEMELKLSATDGNDRKTLNALVVIDNFKKSIQLSKIMFDIYNKYKNNQAKLDTINEVIEQTEKKFQSLKQFEQKIYVTIIPLIQNIENDLDNITNKLGSKSKVSLDVTKWRVGNYLEDLKLQMEQFTRGFKIKDDLARCVEKLMESIFTLLIVYNHIQDYQEHQTFSNLVANISSITADEIDVIDDPNLEEDFRHIYRDLKITVTSNIVLQLYQTAFKAFKQFVFPFADFYLKGITLPSHLKLEHNRNNSAVDILAHQASIEINHIKSKLDRYKASITKHDSCIGTGKFNSNSISTQPFFVWRNEEHKIMISKLLSGGEVLVKADILSSGSHQEDAIKFRVIDLNFKTKNETLQPEINKILQAFKVSMTHMGNSHYRYNDKIYQITAASQNIWYYFDKIAGEPVRKSLTYNKIKNGDFVLSPYALWKLKLTALRNRNNFSFKNLETYKDEIDLELCGFGYYVDKTEDDCLDLKVDNYYRVFTAYDELYINTTTDIVNISSLTQNSDQIRNKRYIIHGFDSIVEHISDDNIFKDKPQCVFHTGEDILEVNNCATSSASPSISSPINKMCNWLKESSLKLFSNVFSSFSILLSVTVKKLSDINVVNSYDTLEDIPLSSLDESQTFAEGIVSNEDETYYNSREFKTTIAERQVSNEETMNNEHYETLESLSPVKELNIVKKLKKSEVVSFNYSEPNRQIDLNIDDIPEIVYEVSKNCIGFAATYNNMDSSPLLTQEKNNIIQFNQSFDVYGSLLLADVITRSITGEMLFKQTLPMSPMQEKALKLYNIERKLYDGIKKMTALYGNGSLTI